jgi:hypothetical protein
LFRRRCCRILWRVRYLNASLSFLLILALPAAEAAALPPPPTIAAISFEGNDRTREQVLRRAVDAEPGDPYTAETAGDIRDDLRSLGLFSKVEVAPDPREVPSGATAAVTVTVEERWTLVPVPFFRSGSSGAAGGLFVLESNLFGLNKQLIGGATYGADGFGGLLVYNDPAVAGSRWLLSVSAAAGRDEVETRTPAAEQRWTYTAERTEAGVSAGYRLSDRLSVRAGGELRFLEVTESERPQTVAPDTYRSVSATAQAGYRDLEPEEFFSRGVSLRAGAELVPADGSWTAEATASQDWLLFSAHRLGVRATAAAGEQPPVAEPRLGGRETQRSLLRGTVSADSFASAGASYELPVLTPPWGTITVAGFYEGGYIVDAGAGWHGGGGGLRLYLSRITFPALGFDVAWNVRYGYPVASVAFGGRL